MTINHRVFKLRKILLLVLVLSPGGWRPPIQAQGPNDVTEFVQKARASYEEKKYASMIENLKLALNVRPNYGSYVYYLAIGYALSGNQSEAIKLLNHLADMGLVYPLATNKDFDSIRNSDEFKAVVSRIENNARPVGHSTTAFTLHEKGLVPEGLAYDPIEKTFYLGSVYQRKIVSINSSGEARDFSSPADGLWSLMGMRVDPKRRLLWVCTASHQQMKDARAAENGISGIFKYDLNTKTLIKKYLLPAQPRPHWLGDLVLDSSGDVFASDSIAPAIYRINHQTDELELFLESKDFVNPQGLAFTADEKHLFMADYLKGVFIIDMKTKVAALLKSPPATNTFGLDGLYYYKGKLIGIQNGVRPNRVVELTVDGSGTEIQRLEVVEANNPVFDEPTLGVLADDALFYIANSQWAMIDDKGGLAAAERLSDPIVLRLKLKSGP